MLVSANRRQTLEPRTQAGALQQRSDALQARTDELQAQAYARDVRRSQQLIEVGDLKMAEDTLLKHVGVTGEKDQRGFEWYHLWRACHDPALDRTISHKLATYSLDFLGDTNRLIVGGWTRMLRVWDLDADSRNKPQIEISAPHDSTRQIAYLPQRESLLTIDVRGVCREFSLNGQASGWQYALGPFELSERLRFSTEIDHDRGVLFVGGGSPTQGNLTAFDLDTLQPIHVQNDLPGRASISMTNGHGLALGYDNDFDGDLTAADITLLHRRIESGSQRSLYDIDLDGEVDEEDSQAWIHDLKQTWFGDANLDGEFNSGDLVAVFASGEYEDDETKNSTWSTGDFDGDREFGSSDLVSAFSDGGYEVGPRAAVRAVPEPASSAMLLPGLFALVIHRCRSNRRSGRNALVMHGLDWELVAPRSVSELRDAACKNMTILSRGR